MVKDIIVTDSSKCQKCYSCVRNCPVKAVKIKDGKAQIIQSRCIQCGNCVKHCSKNAKKILDLKTYALDLLASDKKTIALIAPSFISGLYPMSLKSVINELKNLGVDEVWETAIGAEYVMKTVSSYLKNHKKKAMISSACPAFVSLVEKHYPDLINNLIPICSPMIAGGRLIREKHKDAVVIFIGPCIAKKQEIQNEQFDCIDVVLTFKEIKDLIVNIKDKKVENTDFRYYLASKGRTIPLPGAINRSLEGQISRPELLSIEGTEDCVELVKYLNDKNNNDFLFCDTLMCRGCIDGPVIENDITVYEKRNILNHFIEEREKLDCSQDFNEEYNINMSRYYEEKSESLKQPGENEIRRILEKEAKLTCEDELDCGACGYESCREKAIAVYQGIAEAEMCFPYLVEKKNQLYEELSKRFTTIKELNDEMNAIFESSYDGLIICDPDGKIIRANSAYLNMIGLDELPENVVELEQKGIIYPSATLLAVREKRRVTFLQKIQTGKKLIATGNPIKDDRGKIVGVVTNTRDINELNRLKNNVSNKKSSKKVQGYSGIVANSPEFGEVIDMAAKAAGYKSTVLLLGETGVGKDVIAGFIHYMSDVKDGELVKVNCGAIPENLMEAELFGYEAGAFTGAKREGKKGLFEAADKGTIFLNEIGDLPINMQVKLLQVIQDKKITRIGGDKSIPIDVRIIAATNKDLNQMVKDGDFREDLYYRLNVVPIKIPPLRERKTDIMPLAHHFLYTFNNQYDTNKEFSPNIKDIFTDYYWPGNVRELENIIERIIVTTQNPVITKNNLPRYMFDSEGSVNHAITVNNILPLKKAREEVEKIILKRAYKMYENTYKVADILGVNQSTVVRKIKKYKF